MTFLVFYSSGQSFQIKGDWEGVQKLGPKLIAPTIIDQDGNINLLDPRALVIDEDNQIWYNGREWRHQMKRVMQKAMPEDWPQSKLKELGLSE